MRVRGGGSIHESDSDGQGEMHGVEGDDESEAQVVMDDDERLHGDEMHVAVGDAQAGYALPREANLVQYPTRATARQISTQVTVPVFSHARPLCPYSLMPVIPSPPG